MCLELPPERRAALARLIEAELGRAYWAARAAGADPAALARLLDERRRAVDAVSPAADPVDSLAGGSPPGGDDPEHPINQPVDRPGVGE